MNELIEKMEIENRENMKNQKKEELLNIKN